MNRFEITYCLNDRRFTEIIFADCEAQAEMMIRDRYPEYRVRFINYRLRWR